MIKLLDKIKSQHYTRYLFQLCKMTSKNQYNVRNLLQKNFEIFICHVKLCDGLQTIIEDEQRNVKRNDT